MSKNVRPPDSKNAVNRAGDRIGLGENFSQDISLIDQWRASHAYALNTFKILFLRRIEKSRLSIEFSQRLKRRNTIIDKLRRRDSNGNKLVHDVTSMQDFAGCRLIFENIMELKEFRTELHSPAGRRTINHKLKHENDVDKFDYIERPKFSGYRGIHEVFRHQPRPHRKNIDNAAPWRGLLCEIQYRTRYQHTWATALEISDFLDGERTKFALPTDEPSDRMRFFSLTSELIARNYENYRKAYDDQSDKQLEESVKQINDHSGILNRLSALRAFDGADKLKRHNVLNIHKDEKGNPTLEVIHFNNSTDAINKANELETSEESLNAVYVSSDKPNELRRAYKNYFNDTNDFVQLVTDVLE